MKNTFKFLFGAAIAALTVVSCSQELEHDNANKEQTPEENAITIKVHASADEIKSDDPEVKTYIGTYNNTPNTILWGTGEYMKLALTAGETTTFANSTDESADIFNGDPAALFEFSVTPGSASEYVYQGLYPASAASTTDNANPASYKVNLPTTQNATASSYDPAAYIMVAKPETFNTVQTDWETSFRRGTALNKITLKNVPSGVSISSVKITAAGKKLAGGRHFDLTAGEGSDVYGNEATIEVKYATALSGTNVDVWFTSWNVVVDEGETLTIIAYTTEKKSYTKTITVPATKQIKFQEGYLNTLGASLSGITPEDVATIANGDYVVLARKGSAEPYEYFALKGEANGTRIAYEDYSGSLVNFNGDAALVWTVNASSGSYTFKNRGNFLGWTSGNAADLVAEADYDADKCLMSIDDNGNGTFKVTNTKTSARYLAKNTSSAWFAFYENAGQYGDIVFVPATALESVATPTFSPAAGEVASGTEVTISSATTGSTIYYTTDGSTPTTSSTQGTRVTITAATTIKAIAVKDGMADSDVATAQYTIAGTTDYSTTYTTGSDVSVSVDSGSTSSHVSISSTSYDAVKANKGGTFTITVPNGTTTLHLFIAAWNGEGQTVTVTGGTIDNATIVADSGISGSSTTYTLSGNISNYYRTISVDANTTEITIACASGKRAVIWGVNAEAGTLTVATPTFSITGSNVSIACATDGATIYYTVDGTDPTTSSSEYSSAISISGNQQKTIKALATKSGYDNSEVASKTYYAITISSTSDGTVTAVPFAAEGDEITLNVTPSSGYELATLVYNDGSDHDIKSAQSFTMPASPVTVSATFAVESVSYDFETVAELNALVTSTSATYNGYLTDAVVSFVPTTGTAFVKDATGSVMIYKTSHGLLQGQTYTGEITVTAIKYNSLYSEITTWSGATFTGSQSAVAPETVTLSQLTGHYDDYQNAYVQVAGLTVESVSSKNINVTDGTNTYVVYDNPGTATCAAGDVITAVGTITKYQTTEELKVWAAADITITGSAPKAVTFTQPTGAAATAGCSIAVTVGNNPHTSGNTVASGTTVTLTATEGTDYEFTSWSVTGASVADASASTTTFVMGTSAVSISANFTSTGGNQQTPTLQYTLTPAATGGNSTPHNSYAAAATTTIDGIGWSVMGNSSMTPWRIGGKNITGVNRPIYSTTAISANISQIVITHGAASNITVNSMTVYVCSTAAGAAADTPTNVVASFTPTFVADGDVTINKADNTSWANCFYRIVYNVTVSGNTNRFVSFNEVKFYGTN